MNLFLRVSETQGELINCLFYNELMKLEDRMTYPCTNTQEKEEIIKEIFDLKDLLAQLKGE